MNEQIKSIHNKAISCYKEKKYNQPQLAIIYNVHNALISMIINNKRWA